MIKYSCATFSQLEAIFAHYTFVLKRTADPINGSLKSVWVFFMDNIILTTPDQLQHYIGQAVEAIIPRLADFRRRNEAKQTDNLSLVEAIDYLAELGVPTTRSSLYNLTFRGQIPHRKIGRRTVFSRRELREWVESRTHRPEEAKAEAVRRITRSAANPKRR